eukprot:7363812-Prymnesium_polylepis.1
MSSKLPASSKAAGGASACFTSATRPSSGPPFHRPGLSSSGSRYGSKLRRKSSPTGVTPRLRARTLKSASSFVGHAARPVSTPIRSRSKRIVSPSSMAPDDDVCRGWNSADGGTSTLR